MIKKVLETLTVIKIVRLLNLSDEKFNTLKGETISNDAAFRFAEVLRETVGLKNTMLRKAFVLKSIGRQLQGRSKRELSFAISSLKESEESLTPDLIDLLAQLTADIQALPEPELSPEEEKAADEEAAFIEACAKRREKKAKRRAQFAEQFKEVILGENIK